MRAGPHLFTLGHILSIHFQSVSLLPIYHPLPLLFIVPHHKGQQWICQHLLLLPVIIMTVHWGWGIAPCLLISDTFCSLLWLSHYWHLHHLYKHPSFANTSLSVWPLIPASTTPLLVFTMLHHYCSSSVTSSSIVSSWNPFSAIIPPLSSFYYLSFLLFSLLLRFFWAKRVRIHLSCYDSLTSVTETKLKMDMSEIWSFNSR